MPLRDHFRSPLDDKRSWDELHGGWPTVMVMHLNRTLPAGYFAAPTVHLGTIEVDIFAAFSEDDEESREKFVGPENGGVATAVWAPPKPSLTIQTHLPDQDEYEVRVYERKGRRLVAAIEIISPSNKDRPKTCAEFVSKVISLLKQNVCVSLVDVVSTRNFNLYADVLDFLEGTDEQLGDEPTALYAVTLRCRLEQRDLLLDSWYFPVQLGSPLPALPVWLNSTQSLKLDLEATYEDTCQALRIR